MKRVIALLTLISVTQAYADSYKAPSFKMPDSKPSDVKTQKASWDDESHFKIEESAEAERDLASSPDREAEWAKPSEPAPSKAPDDARIIPWKMIDKK